MLEHLDAHDITDGPGLQHADDDGPPDRRLQAGLPTPRFGLVGLARTQRASLRVVNLARADSRVETGECVIKLSFVDQVGAPTSGVMDFPSRERSRSLPGPHPS